MCTPSQISFGFDFDIYCSETTLVNFRHFAGETPSHFENERENAVASEKPSIDAIAGMLRLVSRNN
jgi:hypothetical protein